MSDILETIEIETAPHPTASVIWMHGLGADGHDFEPIVPEFALPAAFAVRFVFPHAPLRAVTINDGYVMRAWYDVYDLARDRPGRGGGRREDEAGVRASEVAIQALIARERDRGVPPARLVLAGFSQGGAMALHAGVRYPERLASILALSCFLPLASTVASEASAANGDVPILLAHGTDDSVVPIDHGRLACDQLRGLGYRIDWREYPMPHAVCDEEIADIGEWLAAVLARR